MIERRLHPRLVTRIPVEYRVAGSETWEKGIARDLSAGGAGLLTPVQIVPQTVLSHFRFSLPDEEGTLPPIDVEAMVLRCDPIPPEEEHLRYRSGLHFLNLHGHAFQRVQAWIYARLKSPSGG